MLLSDPTQFIINALYLVPALVIALVGHEVAHAAVAVARGDQTPRIDGRLSLNPRHHLDPLGTLAIFFVHFGWARPVRINPYRMRGAFDPAFVALAGPLANLLIAIALSVPIKLALSAGLLDPASPPWDLLLVVFYLNVVLAVVNILPIPGFDGYNLLAALLRSRYGRLFIQVDTNRQLILLVLVLIIFFVPGVFDYVYDPISRLLLGITVRPPGF